MKYHVYVLWSEKLQKRYVGSTSDLKNRLEEHNAGRSRFTKGGVPWLLIHREQFVENSEARRRENFLKTGVGRKWLDEHVSIF